MKARGGFEVSAEWKDGKLEKAEVKSLLGNKCRVMYNGEIIFDGTLKKGGKWKL